jgi:hypothetical protein
VIINCLPQETARRNLSWTRFDYTWRIGPSVVVVGIQTDNNCHAGYDECDDGKFDVTWTASGSLHGAWNFNLGVISGRMGANFSLADTQTIRG